MIAAIGLAGVVGTLLRYYMGKWISSKVGTGFPWGTWSINMTGSFLLGGLYAMNQHHDIPNWAWLIVGTGFSGGFTTFSTFGYETIQLLQSGKWYRAAVYIVASILLGLLCAWLGMITF
ncbi:fluoride efflux transporter CrcB [Paenibacillus eucommiae]|uniref:Fluoride-specific ion channel FluC n=1 Tax=Paenibacillus eucommiae TaxID=1355755 RepID=A0ABS4IR27_9BACL|nr:fluoride efflux transporter CrcB [Paenibacillus eucommiae]MBP1990027.1 CrcB protein [Paenibacillus eucommiae]